MCSTIDNTIVRIQNPGLQSNSCAGTASIDDVGSVVLFADGPREPYTVIGTDDYNEPFVATVTATSPEGAKEAGIAAGLVDAGNEHLVKIIAIYEGDLTESNVTGEAG